MILSTPRKITLSCLHGNFNQVNKYPSTIGLLYDFEKGFHKSGSNFRIADKSKESKQLLQEEIDDREGFTTEAVQTVDWLTETKTELQQLGPRMEAPEVVERIEKLKVNRVQSIAKASITIEPCHEKICENKGTDRLRSNCAADRRLCYSYIDSTIPLLPKSQISSL